MEEETRFDKLTEDIDIDEVEDDQIRDIIIKNNEKGKRPTPGQVRIKQFLLEEVKGCEDYRYLIKNFNIEIRVKYNKNPKK